MEELPNFIIVSMVERMISPTGEGKPTWREARFLKPFSTAIDDPISKPSSIPFPSLPPIFEPESWSLSVNFHGWKCPQKKWKEWVEKMAPVHESVWKKAGIYEAILNSTYQFRRNDDLIFGIAERWCPETNSFVFPWGEATVTLEDMMISGYSVLGSPIFYPLKNEELKGIEKKLIQARREIIRTTAKKACQNQWIKKFRDSGSDIEHEGFLALWLSRFVLPTSNNVISQNIFPIAVRLARGTRIALAPAVLSSIYRDLSLLKRKIFASATLDTNEDKDIFPITIWSPFQLVQIWVLERFVELQPTRNLIKKGEPRSAQWGGNLTCNAENVRLVLDSAKESFNWRPYARTLENWEFSKFYKEKEMWASVHSGSENEIELLSFMQCLKVSELVGLDCIEQYLPHRVAMQFGIDQGLPGCVPRCNKSPGIAWNCYSRPISDVKCYIPSRLFEADVTTTYLKWWKHSMFVLQRQKVFTCPRTPPKCSKVRGDKFIGSSRIIPKGSKEKKAANTAKKLKVSSMSIQGMKTTETSSSLKTTQKILKSKRHHESFISSFKTSPKSLKEKEADGTFTSPNNHSKREKEGETLPHDALLKKKDNDVSVANEFLTKQSSQSLKRKNGDTDELAAPKHPSKFATNLAPSHAATQGIINFLDPPGFLPNCKIERRDSIEEDKLTITEILKSRNKCNGVENRQQGDSKNLSGQYQSHSSSIADNEAAKSSEPVTSVGKVVQGEPGQSWSHSSEQPVEDANNSNKGSLNHTASINSNGGSSSFEVPWLELETRIRKLEKILEERKAAIFTRCIH